MEEKYLTAIIITAPQPVTGNTALKYRNIKNDGPSLQRFTNFAKKFPGAKHINFYWKHSKEFCTQIKIE